MSNKLIHQGRILPTPYPGIYQIDGLLENNGKKQPFSITTHLDAEQVKALAAEPKVTIELPGGLGTNTIPFAAAINVLEHLERDGLRPYRTTVEVTETTT